MNDAPQTPVTKAVLVARLFRDDPSSPVAPISLKVGRLMAQVDGNVPLRIISQNPLAVEGWDEFRLVQGEIEIMAAIGTIFTQVVIQTNLEDKQWEELLRQFSEHYPSIEFTRYIRQEPKPPSGFGPPW